MGAERGIDIKIQRPRDKETKRKEEKKESMR